MASFLHNFKTYLDVSFAIEFQDAREQKLMGYIVLIGFKGINFFLLSNNSSNIHAIKYLLLDSPKKFEIIL
jgi:hypothetical protein